MKISGCIMTKNEEKNIKRCIDSFKNIVHEIIVVDTGSTDKTVEIAKKCGAKVYYYEWNDDFASARNVALNHANGDWIIYLDADEYFYGGTEKNIFNLLNQVKDDIDGLLIKLVNIDSSDGRERSSAHVIRIFRNSKRLRYHYKIHEVVLNEGKGLSSATVDDNSLVIYHTGYSEDISKGKFDRNLKLLLQEEKEDKNPREMLYYYLGDTYYGLKQYEKAMDYMKKFIKTGFENMGTNSKAYIIIIECMIRLDNPYEKVIEQIDEAVLKFPLHPMFYSQKAKINLINNKLENALKFFLEAVEMQKKYHGVEQNFMEGLLPEIYHNIGIIYNFKNDYISALEYYVKSLKCKFDNDIAFVKLINIIKNETAEDIILLLKSVYDENNEKEVGFLVKELSKLKLGKVLMYYVNIWHNKFKKEDSSLTFMLLCNGNFEEAYKYFSSCYFNDWGYTYQLFSVISAILSKNKDIISEILGFVKPSFRRFILIYLGHKDIVLIDEDKMDFLNILKEFILLGNTDDMKKAYNMKKYFENDISKDVGQLFMALGYYEMAIENFKISIDDDYMTFKGYLYDRIGVCYYRLNNYQQSISFIEKALKCGGYKNDALFDYLKWIEERSSNDILKAKSLNLIKEYVQ